MDNKEKKGTNAILTELKNFQIELDNLELDVPHETLRIWAGHINAILIMLIEDVNDAFKDLAAILDIETTEITTEYNERNYGGFYR